LIISDAAHIDFFSKEEVLDTSDGIERLKDHTDRVREKLEIKLNITVQ